MISNRDLITLAGEFSLDVNVVEKDYVLGWLLAAINNHHLLSSKWIFKGGTCLKKCYFETYRFSEDLDYTLIDESQIDAGFLTMCFNEIAQWLYEVAGIEIPKDTIQFKIRDNKKSAEGKVGYIGPMQRRRDPARIKLDLTVNELVVTAPDLRLVHHPYKDNPKDGIKSSCYSFSEIFAEKLRALCERARPRDLYDVIHLFRHANQAENGGQILEILKKKCEFKSISIPTMSFMERHPKRDELRAEWKNMLGHQLPTLPNLDDFWQELPNVFNWLEGKDNKPKLDSFPFQKKDVDITWNPPKMISSWNTTIPLELIRYAAANHLCVKITYKKKDLTIKEYLIEPYELKMTKDRKLLLFAVKHYSNKPRSFLVERIQTVKATEENFTPQYLIKLTPFSLDHLPSSASNRQLLS